MKIYIAKNMHYELVYVYTSKKQMLKEVKQLNEYGEECMEVQEPIIFDLTKKGVLDAMRELTGCCGNTADITIGEN